MSETNQSQVAYSYLNDDIIKEFEGVGSENLIQLLETPDKSSIETDELIGTIFIELLMALDEDKLDSTQIVTFLSMAIKQEDLAVRFCQVLNIFPLTPPIEKLLKQLHMNQKVIKPETMARTLSNETISKVGIVPADSITKQLNVRKRDEFYTQKKFNLFHEEPEGFSRLIVEFMNILKSKDIDFQVDYSLRVTQQITGHYNLDPSRCFDVIFDCFSNNLIGNENFILNFFKKSSWWPINNSDNSCLETLSNGGNDNISKLIGLKLLKHPNDKALPETLKLLVSLLIKEGMISFGSIYKFFTPDEQSMDQLESIYQKDLQDKVFKSSANALALAAPLMDEDEDDGDNKKNTTGNNSGNKNSKNSKNSDVSLETKLNCNIKFQMLRVFLSNGLYWPSIYILTKYPFLAKIDPEINELICRLLHHMISPLYNQITCFLDQEFMELQQSKKIAISRLNNEVSFQEFPCVEFLSFKATIQSYSQKKFVYFYQDWCKGLPMIYNSNDLFVISRQLLKFIDVEIAKDVQLFAKICDIGGNELDTHPDNDQLKQNWFTYFRNVIFPAISLIEENSIVVDKAYKILSFFPKQDRFNLYSELHQVTSKNNPLIKISYGRAEKSTKDVLKRLSKETVRPMMRRIAKISFSNPLPCFLTILQQIESYDNLNSLVVETARYFNGYGWDVLTLAIMMRLTTSGRSNVQINGLHERQWIQSLASFIGKICQKYPNSIDISTLMEFLLKSLHTNDTTGLIVLKEMFMSMGGIKTITNLTLEQIYMANSGKSLQKMVYNTIDDLRYDRVKSGTVLIKKLIELDCINELLVLLCQVHEKLIYGEQETHLKVLATRKDELVLVIQLFCDLISFFANDDKFKFSLTSISNLSITYNVPPEWSFEVWRKYLNPITNQNIKSEMDEFKKFLPVHVWNSLPIDLYGLFWQLSLYDINYIKEYYDENLEKYDSSLSSLESTYNKSKRSYASRQLLDKQANDLETAKAYIKDLPIDKAQHESHAKIIDERFKSECGNWFNDDTFSTQINFFLQYCLLPRVVHSSYDAVYGAKFLFKLYEFNINNFSLIASLNELINTNILFGSFFTSTPTESENLGLLFAEIFTILNSWNNNDKFNDLPVDLLDCNGNKIEFNNYRSLLYGYQETILKDVLRSLKTNDYMCRRNCITFLKNTVAVFPVVEDQCEQLVDAILNIVNHEDREDLKLSGNALIGLIKSGIKNWIHLWDFIEMSPEDSETHKKKREEAQEKIRKEAEAKKLKEKEEREALEKIKREKEQTERDRKEKEAAAKEQERKELRQKEAAKFTYNDETKGSNTPTSSTRNEVRKDDEGAKKRYDYYSKYEKDRSSDSPSKDVKSELKSDQKPEKEPEKEPQVEDSNSMQVDEDISQGSDKEVGKDDSNISNTEKVEKEKTERQKTERTGAKDTSKQTGGARLTSREAPAVMRSNRDERSTYIPSQPKALTPETKERPIRTPLAPQLSLRKDQGSFGRTTYDNRKHDSRYRYNNGQGNGHGHGNGNNHKSNNDNGSLPPPPPPPPPPAAPSHSSNNQRPGYNNKRKYDYQGGGRPYDKRQRY